MTAALSSPVILSLSQLEALVGTLRVQQQAQLKWMVSRIRERVRDLLRAESISEEELDSVTRAAFEEFAPVFHLIANQSSGVFTASVLSALFDHVERVTKYLGPTGVADLAEYSFRGFFAAMIALAEHPDSQRSLEAEALAAREHAEANGGAMPRMSLGDAPVQVVRPQIVLFLVSEAMELGLEPAKCADLIPIALRDVVGWVLPRVRASGIAVDPWQGLSNEERVKRALRTAAVLRASATEDDERAFANARITSLR